MTKQASANAIYAIMGALYIGYSTIFNFQFLSDHANSRTSIAELFHGQAASEFESAYRGAALYRERAVELFGAYRYRIFGEGRTGVLVGEDGWLFTDEEFKSDPSAERKLVQTADFIAGVGKRLNSGGTRLVVAVVPAKADIYPEKLGRYRFPAEPAGRYAKTLDLLASRHIVAPDLKKALLGQKRREQVFLKADTHWTPAGAVMAANVLGGQWHGSPQAQAATYTLQQTARFDVVGDLNRFIGGAIPGEETIPLYEAASTAPEAPAVDLFGAPDVPVVLVGTSYSANPNWGFEAALKASLGADVVNVAEQGEGPFKPMADYVGSPSFRQSPPKLVIWEIPVRFMLSLDPAGPLDGIAAGSAVSASR